MTLWIAAGLIFLGAVLLTVGLCQMAAMGDRKLERARRDLAGPQGRAGAGGQRQRRKAWKAAIVNQLSDAQTLKAEKMWREGHSLGEIAKTLGCSVYRLSPWIYRESFGVAVDAAAACSASRNQKERPS